MVDAASPPLPTSWSVERGRDTYLEENGWTVASYDDAWTQASLFGVRFRVPNTSRHRWAIMLHDLHHVATGYGTDPTGEGEISMWELRRGLGGLGVYVGSIVISGALLGLLVSPRRAVEAWRRSGRGASLFGSTRPYAELLGMTIGELREELGVPLEGVSRHPRRRHALAQRLKGAH